MAIQSPVVDAGPTVLREATPVVPAVFKSNGTIDAVTMFPVWSNEDRDWSYSLMQPFPSHGQIMILFDAFNGLMSMYVGYNPTGGAATGVWKKTSAATSYIDPATGKDWDPLQNF